MNQNRAWICGLLVATCAATVALAGDGKSSVVGWRMDGDGRFAVKNPPTEWSPEKNIIWSAKLDRFSNASPIVVGDRIFICSEPTTLICLDSKTGKELWRRTNRLVDSMSDAERAKLEPLVEAAQKAQMELADKKAEYQKMRRLARRKRDDAEFMKKYEALKAEVEELEAVVEKGKQYALPPTDPECGYSSATPLSDGETVWAVFGNGMLGAYSLEGERRWLKLVHKPKHIWGHSASPVYVNGNIVVHLDDVMVNLDGATGNEKWRVEIKKQWGTSAPVKIGGADYLVTPGGEIVRAADGKVMVKGLQELEFNAPVVQGGVLYMIDRKAAAYKLPEKITEGMEIKPLWESRLRGKNMYASPVIMDGLIYIVAGTEALNVVDAGTGDLLCEQKLELGGDTANSVYPSVCEAGGMIYVFGSSGQSVILKPGKEYKEIARLKLEPIRSTPVFIDGRMYYRGLETIYCIGDKAAATASR